MCICRSAATWRALWASARSCQEDLVAPWNTNIIRLSHRICCLYISRTKSSDLASVRVSNSFVELLAFHHQVTITRRNNSTPRRGKVISLSPFWEKFCILLGRDGPGRVDVVAGDHADRDTRALALLDRGRHLGPHWILARTKNHFLSQLKIFDPKIVHFLSPQCQQCRRRSC